ncbi:MAG: heavy-metal-associated domain-containing protein [Gemmatimonadota bacterium]|nr:heavy-metal-associated domain-containing protein [Gemmatimonadota bacterium]
MPLIRYIHEIRFTYIVAMITTASIAGMTCAHCVRAVFTALGGVRGVSRADVSIGRAVIDHDGTASHGSITEAVSIAGYEVVSLSDDRRALPVV